MTSDGGPREAGDSVTSHPRIRPGGRSERVGQAVLDAADELAQEGAVVSVAELAARSGVSEVTIYRRWRTPENVMLEAAALAVNRRLPVQPTGDLRNDLVRWAQRAERSMRTPEGQRLLSAVVRVTLNPDGTGDPASARQFLAGRGEQIRQLINAADPAVSLTVEDVLDQVLAPIYLRRMFGYAAPRTAEQLVDGLLSRPGQRRNRVS